MSACSIGPGVGTQSPKVLPSQTSGKSHGPVPTPTTPPAQLEVMDKPRVTNWLFLGGDYRAHREGTRYGNKTDVMLLVRITETNPVRIDIVQLPRNYYQPIPNMADFWLFAIYRAEGFVGLHYYFQEAFDVDLHGIFYIHMDNFLVLVDDAFPDGIDIPYSVSKMKGQDLLDYMRDNENNWTDCLYYDCENRQPRVLVALAVAAGAMVKDEPLRTANIFVKRWGKLFETDISSIDQWAAMMSMAWNIKQHDYTIHIHKLTQSGAISYGDTPLPVRGWKPTGDVKSWFAALGG